MKTSTMRSLSTRQPDRVEAHTETSDSAWKWLYRIAGAAALIAAVCIPIQIIVFVIWPPPPQGSASDWFTLLQQHRLVGLIDLDLLLVVDNVLGIPIVLALYVALRRSSESIIAIASALAFIGIIFFIASNPSIEMLSLSDRYVAAATDAERASFQAAGQAMLATWQGTTFHAGYILSSVAGIAIPAVMLRSTIFGKLIAYLGILANVIGLGLYLPVIGLFLSVGSVVFLEVWYILVGRRLFQLAQGIPTMSLKASTA
jgi:hypothetical protein